MLLGAKDSSSGHCAKCCYNFSDFLAFFLHEIMPRKGLDVDIVTANASKESDKIQILNSIALPRAATKQLQMDADQSHQRYSMMHIEKC